MFIDFTIDMAEKNKKREYDTNNQFFIGYLIISFLKLKGIKIIVKKLITLNARNLTAILSIVPNPGRKIDANKSEKYPFAKFSVDIFVKIKKSLSNERLNF